MNDEQANEMTLPEAREFIASVPWRQVQDRPARGEGVLPVAPDRHWYVINGWPEVPADLYWAFVRLVKRKGYLGRYTAPYRPDRTQVNSYLEIDQHVYWTVPPKQICRTRIEHRQHEPIPEQGRLLD
jgi:hypothetical protein